MKNLLAPLILILLIWSAPTSAGQMSTYIEGIIVKRTKSLIIVQTKKGTYWIKAYRPPSHTKRYSELETGFWVQTRHIKRFRPISFDARVDKKFSNAN